MANNNINNNRPDRGLIPPERPPKKPHLRAGGSTGGISPDQEMRRIEASVQELMTLNQQQQQQQQSRQVVAPPPLPTTRKPPAPDPPVSPHQRPSGPATSPVTDMQVVRSASPDLPPPPPPTIDRADEEVADCEDPLPPPPPHVVLMDDLPSTAETTLDDQTPSPTPTPTALPVAQLASTYHHESYMAHRKGHHSPNGGYHRRSADNLLESSMTSHGTHSVLI